MNFGFERAGIRLKDEVAVHCQLKAMLKLERVQLIAKQGLPWAALPDFHREQVEGILVANELPTLRWLPLVQRSIAFPWPVPPGRFPAMILILRFYMAPGLLLEIFRLRADPTKRYLRAAANAARYAASFIDEPLKTEAVALGGP